MWKRSCTQGFNISPRVNPEHDLLVDGMKVEVKFSLASKGVKDCFTWNHLACENTMIVHF